MGCLRNTRLLEIDRKTDHPQLKLLQSRFPTPLECFHPKAIRACVGNINNNLDEIVAVDHALLPPMPFDLLCFVARRSKVLDNFHYCFSQPLGRNLCAVVELEWEQHLESPPLAGHMSPSLLR